MNRSVLDKLISWTGIVVAALLVLMAVALLWAHNFIHSQVQTQLSSQKIYFPDSGSQALTSLPASDQSEVATYAGQQLTTGKQAQVFADHYIAVHLQEIGGGKTYAELSAQSLAHPTDQKLAGQVQNLFRGETLRGLLLNAYAFDTMALVAEYLAIGAAIGALVLIILAGLGLRHARNSR